MGLKLRVLAQTKLKPETIFNNRFVIECCEKFHVHYRNLRIIMNTMDWEQLCKGAKDAWERWKSQDEPSVGNKHIELCRKTVAMFPHSDDITVSLNRNLYKDNKGKIFAEGANFDEDEYIHLKIRDLRLEMPIEEFRLLADTLEKAKNELDIKS